MEKVLFEETGKRCVSRGLNLTTHPQPACSLLWTVSRNANGLAKSLEMGILECRDNTHPINKGQGSVGIAGRSPGSTSVRMSLDPWGSHKCSVNVVISLWLQGMRS